jgi:hypothetical protein
MAFVNTTYSKKKPVFIRAPFCAFIKFVPLYAISSLKSGDAAAIGARFQKFYLYTNTANNK